MLRNCASLHKVLQVVLTEARRGRNGPHITGSHYGWTEGKQWRFNSGLDYRSRERDRWRSLNCAYAIEEPTSLGFHCPRHALHRQSTVPLRARSAQTPDLGTGKFDLLEQVTVRRSPGRAQMHSVPTRKPGNLSMGEICSIHSRPLSRAAQSWP